MLAQSSKQIILQSKPINNSSNDEMNKAIETDTEIIVEDKKRCLHPNHSSLYITSNTPTSQPINPSHSLTSTMAIPKKASMPLTIIQPNPNPNGDDLNHFQTPTICYLSNNPLFNLHPILNQTLRNLQKPILQMKKKKLDNLIVQTGLFKDSKKQLPTITSIIFQ